MKAILPFALCLFLFTSCSKQENIFTKEKTIIGVWEHATIVETEGTNVCEKVYTLHLNEDSSFSIEKNYRITDINGASLIVNAVNLGGSTQHGFWNKTDKKYSYELKSTETTTNFLLNKEGFLTTKNAKKWIKKSNF